MPFTQKTLDFLLENRIKDDKSWYEEHKSEYIEFVLNPLKELVIALTPTINDIDDLLICEPKIGTISRIYRDTRFSLDKSLFRDVQWVGFIRNKGAYYGYPGFFFEFSPAGFRYGVGYYTASTASMNSIRKLILNEDKLFKKALKLYESQNLFALEGELYKKSHYPDKPERLKNWLDRKNIDLIHNSTDFKALFSENLADTLIDGFNLLRPCYHFLLKAELEKDGK